MISDQKDLTSFIENWRPLIDDKLRDLVPELQTQYNTLHEAARYALFTGGKRLRPLLALATALAFGQDGHSVVQPACALEMIHTYSLVHDDLPAMDDDDFRRGKPTVHRVYSEATAILAGDFLLTRAFEVVAEAEGLDEAQRLQMLHVLAAKAGGHGMIGGQVLDLAAEGRKDVALDTVTEMHSRKTAALITAGILLGGIDAHCSPAQLKILEEVGLHLGLAFQAIDDVLDVTQSQEKKGRAISSDIANKKSTLVSLLGIEGARSWALEKLRTAQNQLKELVGADSLLSQLADKLVHRTT